MNTIIKIAWAILLIVSLYFYCCLTFIFYILDNFGENQYSVMNLVLPNFLTIIVLFLYTKELMFGYHPKSRERNIKSLLIIFVVILFLTFVQFSQFEFMFKDADLITILVFVTILTSYTGVILNRFLVVKSLN